MTDTILDKILEEKTAAGEAIPEDAFLGMRDFKKTNAKVVKAGLYWDARCQQAVVTIKFALADGSRVGVESFPEDCDFQMLMGGVFETGSDGAYLEDIAGMPCCCWLDGKGRLKYVSNFLDDTKTVKFSSWERN